MKAKVSAPLLEFRHMPASNRLRAKLIGVPWLKVTFGFVVVLPTLACALFYALVASDRYISETRFVIRELGTSINANEDDEDSGTVGGAASALAAFSQDNTSAYMVSDFVTSPAIVSQLKGEVDWSEIYSPEGTNSIERLTDDPTDDDILRYLKSKINIYIDTPSSIVVMSVEAFSPESAQKLSDQIVKKSEDLLFDLSRRAASELIFQLEQNLTQSRSRYQDALSRLEDYRRESGIVEPETSLKLTAELLTGLLGKRIEIQAQLTQSRQLLNESDIKLQLLEGSLAALDEQVELLRAELASQSETSNTLVSAITVFSELQTQVFLTEQLYMLSQRSLTTTSNELSRRSQYLSVFSGPTLASESTRPRGLVNTLLVFIMLIVAWSISALIWASVQDHRLT